MKNKMRYLFLLCLCWPLWLTARDEIQFTSSSKSTVELGEQFRIVFELNADGSRFTGPDFGGLRVITGPMTSSSSSIQIINGQMSRTYSQTYTYVVIANREGEIEIGPARVTVDGKSYQTNPFTITVKPAGTTTPSSPGTRPQQQDQPTGELTEKDLFLRAIIDNPNPVLGEQVIITYRLYTRVPVSSLSVNKLSSFPGFWTKNLLDEQAGLQQSTQMVDGEEYVVADVRKLALFPQRTGKLNIEPMELEGTAQIRLQRDSRRTRDPFESFFNDPFFNRNIRNVKRILVSNPVEIEVKALPFTNRPASFEGAVGQFNLQSKVDKTSLKTNEAFSVVYTLSGSGNIELVDLTEPAFPPDFDVFDPKVSTRSSTSPSGVSGSKSFEYLIIPRSPGQFEIPAIDFSFYNPKTQSFVSLQTDAFAIMVERGEGDDATAGLTGRAQEDIRYLGSDVRHIKTNPHTLQPIGTFFFFSTTYFAVMGVGLLAFFLLLLYFRRQERLRGNRSLLRNRQATKMAKRRLKTAHKHMKVKEQNEFYTEMSQALWGYIADKFSIPRADLSIETVQESLKSKNAPEEVVHDFTEVLNNCEFARFAPGDAAEKMEDLYKQGIAIIAKAERIIK